MADNAGTTPESPTVIWTSRLPKEWASLDEKLRQAGSSRRTCRIVVLSKVLDPERGVCKCTFRLVPRSAAGEEGEQQEEEDEDPFLAEETSVVLEIDASSSSTGTVAYPFVPPILKVVRGAELLPSSAIRSEDQTILLPMLEAWTPKLGLAGLMLAAAEAVQAYTDAKDDDSTTTFVPEQALSLELFGDRLFQGTVAQQGGGVLQRYLGVTDTYLLNVKAHAEKLETVVVVKAQPQAQVSKLKYKRGASISVEFRDGDRWMFAMPRAAECVEAIQGALEAKGVVGRKTSQTALNHITRAKACLQEAQRRETALVGGGGGGKGSIERVQEVSDLYKHSIEKFATISSEENKQKTTEAISLLQAFLSRPEVQHLLTNKPPPPASTSPPSSRRLPSLPKVNFGQMFAPKPKTQKGEVLPRSATAEIASGEDDGLAREEKRLGPLSSRLKELLDLNLNDPSSAAADARDRGGSTDSISSSSSSGAGGGERGGEGREGGRHVSNASAAMHELDEVLGEASKELESLKVPGAAALTAAPTTTAAERTAAAGAAGEEEEIVI